MINPTPKEVIDKNKQNMKLLKKLNHDNNNNHHILKLKCKINNINLANSNIIFSPKSLKKKNKISSMASFSPISTYYKSKIFSREKTPDNLNLKQFSNFKGTSDNPNIKVKNDFSYNLSPKQDINNDKLFTKIFLNISKTKGKFFKELNTNNKILSPSKDHSSFNNTDISDHEKNKIIEHKIKIQTKENFYTKMLKKKFLNIDSVKFKDNENSQENNKDILMKEKIFYNKINKENKDFYFGERFRKKLMDEYTKFKPIHYHSFFEKNNNSQKK